MFGFVVKNIDLMKIDNVQRRELWSRVLSRCEGHDQTQNFSSADFEKVVGHKIVISKSSKAEAIRERVRGTPSLADAVTDLELKSKKAFLKKQKFCFVWISHYNPAWQPQCLEVISLSTVWYGKEQRV